MIFDQIKTIDAHHRLLISDIRTDLTQHIHANEWRIASWFVSMIERYICYDVELGAITREQTFWRGSSLLNENNPLCVFFWKNCTREHRRIWRIVTVCISFLSLGCRRILAGRSARMRTSAVSCGTGWKRSVRCRLMVRGFVVQSTGSDF